MFDLPISTITAFLTAIIGWAIALWKTVVANKYKKDSVVFENRLKIYNEYFEKLDNINDRLIVDFQEFVGPTVARVYHVILTDPTNSAGALLDMQAALSQILQKTSKNINQSNQELQKLRFIASKKTLLILDKYKELAELQVNKISELFGTIDIQYFTNFDQHTNSDLRSIGERMIIMKDNLEKQMREDLGIE